MPPSLLINESGKIHLLLIDTTSAEGDTRQMLSGNKRNEVKLRQTNEGLVNVVNRKTRIAAQQALIYIDIIDEDAAIMTQHREDKPLLRRKERTEKLASSDVYTQSAGRFLLVAILDVASLVQQVERTDERSRVIAKGAAELLEVELTHDIHALPLGDAQKAAQQLVSITHIIEFRKLVRQPTRHYLSLLPQRQQNSISLLPVSTRTAGLLKVGLYGIRYICMKHQTHIGLVDAHTKGVGSHHNAELVTPPALLTLVLLCGIQTRMVECGREA